MKSCPDARNGGAGRSGEDELKRKQEEKRLRKLTNLNAREDARKATHAATKAAQARRRVRMGGTPGRR